MTSTSVDASLATSLREQAERTHLFRTAAAEAKARLAEKEAAFQLEHAALIAEVDSMRSVVQEAEYALRTMAETAYKRTGEKHPAPGVGIKVSTVLAYDEVQALAWAREQGAALILDKKGFESIAKVMRLPFVTKSEVAQATLARDLGAALATADATASVAEEVV